MDEPAPARPGQRHHLPGLLAEAARRAGECAALVDGPAGATGQVGTVPGSVGRVMPGTELRVVDPRSRADLAAGERGEL
jgi:hypothetical protein